MKEFFRKVAVAYLAGAIGGLAYALVAWLCHHSGLFKMFSVNMKVYQLTWPYLADRILYGSLWALLLVFIGPFLKAKGLISGLVLSLIPSAYVLFVHYPSQGLGFLGINKGVLTFIFVLLFNATWGFIAGGIYADHYKK